MSCSCNRCNCNPCSCEDSCDAANESVASALTNFITAFFGTLTKSCVDNKVVWVLPCNLDTGIAGFPRVEGEGLACYFVRVLGLQVGAASVAVTGDNIDWSLGTTFYKTLSANTTFTFSNETDGKNITIAVTNTSGNFTVTWPSGIKWKTGIPPSQTPGAVTDVITFIDINGTIYGSSLQNMF